MRYLTHAPTGGPGTGLPHLGSAISPTMTRTYAGWSSRGQIHGQPGTQGIPMSGPAAIRQGVNTLANVGVSQSTNAPDVIFPSVYYEAGNPHEKFPCSVFSDDQMPVPARRPGNILKFNPYKARKGGQRQVTQPEVIQRWRGLKGTPSG